MTLYNKELISLYNRKIEKGSKNIYISLCFVLPIFILCLCLVKLNTKTLFIILTTIDLSIFAFIFIYNLIENIIKSKDYIKHIEETLNGYENTIEGTIVNISNTITLKRNIHIVEIEIKKENKSYKAYFNVDLFDMDLKKKHKIKVNLLNNFINEYEG